MYLDKPIPLRGSSRKSRRRGSSRSRRSGLIVVLMLGLVNYFLFFGGEGDLPADNDADRPADATSVALVVPPGDGPRDADEAEVDDFGEPVGRVIEGKLGRGQTVLRALRAEGIDSQAALPLVNAMSEVFDFKRAQVGDAFVLRVNDEGQVTQLTYTQSPLDIFEVDLTDEGGYEAKRRKVPTRIDVAHIGCAIRSSLYESMARCGEGAQLAGVVIDLFAWDVDFFQDVREGDEVRMLVEKVSVDGRFLKYGRVLAAEYRGKLAQHRIIGYRGPDGEEGYFTTDGRSVRKDFLKSPLKYTRVSAHGKSAVRKSLKSAAPVVYTAQADTPVWAVGAGTVVAVNDNGGDGRAVTIRHENGYTSTYSQLGTVARSVTPGSFVSQKTVLGKVGKTTDGHELVYSLRKNGRLMDPLKTRFTEGDPIPPEHRDHFDHEVEQAVEDLEAMPVIGIHERRS